LDGDAGLTAAHGGNGVGRGGIRSDLTVYATRSKPAASEITAFYMTMGTYDMVIVIDAPNDDAFVRLAISFAKGGNIRTVTLKAFDEDQYRKIIESIG
jgi:uncharacterized protein with GYD domain